MSGIVGDDRPAFVLTDNFIKAVRWATDLHADQARKGTAVPYAAHLLGVSSLVLEAGGTEEEAIAGLLHDAVEDGEGMETDKKIRELFGPRIADIVLACSDSTDKEHKRLTRYWDRKQAYLDHLEASTDERAVLVSLADKVHNARAIATDLQIQGNDMWGKFHGKPAEILHYYVECLRIGRAKNVPDALLVPLHTAVVTISEYVVGEAS